MKKIHFISGYTLEITPEEYDAIIDALNKSRQTDFIATAINGKITNIINQKEILYIN